MAKSNKVKVEKMIALLNANPTMQKNEAAKKAGLAHISSYYTWKKRLGDTGDIIPYKNRGIKKSSRPYKRRSVVPESMPAKEPTIVALVGTPSAISQTISQIFN